MHHAQANNVGMLYDPLSSGQDLDYSSVTGVLRTLPAQGLVLKIPRKMAGKKRAAQRAGL